MRSRVSSSSSEMEGGIDDGGVGGEIDVAGGIER